jgi:hypothetical protein
MSGRLDIREQLFDCLPAGRYALAGLLRMVDIVETTSVPTAAVECVAQPRLLVNPDFVERHANTPQKLMMLVLHEVHHVLLGHTRRLACDTASDNFVFDCVINALLCRMFPQPEYTALFTDFYSDSKFPSCLLRPPADWDPDANEVPLPPALATADAARQVAAETYRALYSVKGASYEEIRRLLPNLQGVLGEDGENAGLLGDHDGSAKGNASIAAGVFAQAVGDIVAHWPTPPEPLRGRSLNELMAESRTAVKKSTSNRQCLRALIRKVAGENGSHRARRQLQPQAVTVESPLPVQDRRALVLRALVATPLLYRTPVDVLRSQPCGERVHVYLDVSGSVNEVKGALYGAILDCGDRVHPVVHLFSTEVADCSLAQLRRGWCKSTGGTDIRCVARHMAKHRVRRALIVTDGFVGQLQATQRKTMTAARLAVAYTTRHSRDDLADYADTDAVLSI